MTTSASKPLRLLAFELTDPRDQSLEWLSGNGVDVVRGRADREPGYNRYSEDDIIGEAAGCVGVLGSSSATFTRRVIEALPELRVISKIGVGVDSIDIEAATENGVVVTNTPEEAGPAAVAEHTIAIMLAVLKRLTLWTPAALRGGRWRGTDFTASLDGATVGLIGFGRIGRAVAARLAGWNVNILYCDPLVEAGVTGAERTEMGDLLARSDVVSLHCAATAENRHLINRDRLARMKPGAVLVNAARGSLVDTAALVAALKSGALAGAGLDVFEKEPPDHDDELLTLPNVVTTPHVAARTLRVFLDRRWRAAHNFLAVARGEPCPDIVNPEALTSRRKS
jgi:D-3-phosphoglycerate dehydrogenase